MQEPSAREVHTPEKRRARMPQALRVLSEDEGVEVVEDG